MYRFKTSGVCAQEIAFEVEGTKIKSVKFIGGCDGNLKGISSLVAGMEISDVAQRLKGLRCGMKNTSCPDQLAAALLKLAAE